MSESNQQMPKGTWRDAMAIRWKSFWAALLDPWNLGLLIVAGAMLYFSQQKVGESANVIAQLVLAISTGLLGARMANEMAALTGQGVIEARARVAVRSLQLLFRTTAGVEERVEKFLEAAQRGSVDQAVTQRNYEEVISLCRLLQEQANSSIDNWRDVVPEAQIISSIGEITALKNSLDAQRAAVVQLSESLDSARIEAAKQQNMSADMKEQLARRETDFELQIRELNDSLARTKAQLEMAKANSASAPRSNAISNAFLRNPSAYTTVPTLLGNSAGKIDPPTSPQF